MIGGRTRISGTLRVLTPLHIGSGKNSRLAADAALETSDDEFALGLVLMDGRGLPYIPGSSIKGVLRRLSSDPATLFGPESGCDLLASGKVIFWAALHQSASPVQGRVPYGDAWLTGLSKNNRARDIYFESQTVIDGETGVAERARLFHNEQVLPGTAFKFSITLAASADEAAEKDLVAILARLCANEGVGFGKNTRQGKGRVRLLSETVEAETVALEGSARNTTSIWCEKLRAAKVGKPLSWQRILTLRGDGPFLIADRSPRPKGPPGEASQIYGLSEFGTDAPRLTGASLIGALRARFAWERALAEPGENDDSDKTFSSLDALTPTERLFGVTGWRGRISLGVISLPSTTVKQKIMSVRIDRFSGAPIDNALFGTEAWIAPVFRTRLSLENRPGLSAQERSLLDRDDALFKEFVAQLSDPVWGGLTLGMGENKGFGTFAVEVSDDQI